MDQPQLAARMAGVAADLLDALDGPARERASHPLDDATRRDWHYVPRRRPGLSLAEMDAPQQKLAFALLATGTSPHAYAATTTIVALEDVLDELEGGTGPRRGRTGPWGRHRAEYSVTVFGEPGEEAWGWRFEGHHVSHNVTLVGGRVTAAPAFLGANPAEVAGPAGSVVVRPLPAEEDVALALIRALGPAARDRARVADEAPEDILTGAAPAVDDLDRLDGIRVAELPAGAVALVEALIEVYLSRAPEPAASPWRDAVAADLGDLRFGFAGEPEHRRPLYYRLVGPRLLVEYDNTQNDANHVHTVARDPLDDFGLDALRRHRADHHRG